MLIDVVDEHDNIIGQEDESVCHEKKLWHRVAVVLVFKDESFSEVLLQKRALHKQNAPGLLGPIGGHLKSGETYLQGMLRELHEEMLVNSWLPGVDITPLFKLKDEELKEHMIVYRLAYRGPFNINKEEVESYAFYNIKELMKEINEHPDKYVGKSILKEYKARFLKQ
jgi:isopentenyldiphosphate isomerase